MTNKNDPAYPLHPSASSEATHRNGLTKREYFAGLAMQGLLSNSCDEPTFNTRSDIVKHYARLSVDYADALLEALNEGGDS